MNRKIFWVLFFLPASFCLNAETVVPDTVRVSQSTSYSAVELLSGKVSGVLVDNFSENSFESASVTIRGLNSFRTDNQPLWVVDGVEISSDAGRNLDPFWQYEGAEPLHSLNPLSFLSTQEIESIEVLKDAAATAIYGSKGANGVIIVKTRKAASRKFETELASNVGLVCNTIDKIPAVTNNHYLSLSGTEKATSFYVTGNYRDEKGAVTSNRGQFFGLRTGLDTSAGDAIKFGMSAIFGGGNVASPISGLADYEDFSKEFRGLLSTYLHFKIKKFSIKIDGGADYCRSDREIWYGTDTEFGACTPAFPDGGAGAVLANNTLSYNAKIAFEYRTFFAVDHKIETGVSAKIYGDANTFNTQNGRNFVNHSLKAKGLNYKSTQPQNYNFDYSMFHPALTAGLSYNWKYAAGINTSLEVDSNSRFNPGSRVHFRPSATGYLDFARIFNFDTEIVSKIRIEGGWGRSGKEVYASYEWFGKFVLSGYPVPQSGTEMFYDGLETLSTSEWHAGGTIGLSNDRFKISLVYYDRNTNDSFDVFYRGGNPMVYKETTYLKYVDPVLVYKNETNAINRGYELDIDLGLIRKKKLVWNLSIAGSYNQNNFPLGRVIGYKLGSDGKPLDITGEGRITPEDMIELGRTLPVWIGGFSTELRWDKLSFIATADGTQGMLADYFKLDNVGVNYHFPLKVKWLKSVDVRLAGRNVAVLQKQYGPYRLSRSVVFGISLKF